MTINLKLIAASFFLALPLVVPQVSDATDVNAPDASQNTRPVYKIGQCHGEFQDGVPDDVMKSIFIEASEEGADPRSFELVCKNWHNSMGSSLSKGYTPISGLFGPAYTTKRNDFFMEDCLRRFWKYPLKGLTLRYKDPETKEIMSLKAPHFEHTLGSTFDLSKCGETSKDICITKSVEEFFKVGQENENKIVVLLSTHDLIKGVHADKFGDIKIWDGKVPPVEVLWRWGNSVDLSKYEQLNSSPQHCSENFQYGGCTHSFDSYLSDADRVGLEEASWVMGLVCVTIHGGSNYFTFHC